MKKIHILLPILIIVFPALPLWGLMKGEYEKKFDAHGKKLIVDWGVFESIEERKRLEAQLRALWEVFNKNRDDFRLTRRIELTRSTDLFSLSDEIEKDNDLLKITLSRGGDSIVSQEQILKSLRRRPFFYYTKETLKYKRRKVVRDLGREGYYYEEDGQIKYAAVDTVELLERKEEIKRYFEEEERKEKKREEVGF